MEPITTFTSRLVALPMDNIDTDQIIPARYLKTTSRAGLGQGLFSDWRYDADGQPKPDFILNDPTVQGAQVLVAGHNFGCGSSREHAPWALLDYGIKAVVSTDFADIFRNNSLKTGMLPIIVDDATRVELIHTFDKDPQGAQVTIDLENQCLTLPSGRQVTFPIDAFAKHCLIMGVDQMGFLLNEDQDIQAYEASHPARVDTSLALAGLQ